MGWKSNEPWHRELGGWFTQEAVPFIGAGIVGTVTMGPIGGAVAAMTTTNNRGGNPTGDFGKGVEQIVHKQATKTIEEFVKKTCTDTGHQVLQNLRS